MKINNHKYFCLFILLLFAFLGNSSASATKLKVLQHYQEKDHWCWAAVSQAVLEYYGTVTTQKKIADYGTAGADIDNYLYGSGINPTRNGIDLILLHFARLATTHSNTILSELLVQSQISNRRPFVIRWGWDNGGGHFVVADGIELGLMYLMDPWYGPTIGSYDWVVSGSTHTWTHTLAMNSSPGQFPAQALLLLLH
jgi:hypothetical protein